MTSECADSWTLPEHETHRHRDYGLTCAQYEGLLNACDRSCQTCGRPASSTTRRKLFIDHHAGIGDWAVRGLLCGKCNAGIRWDREPPHWATAYLASPWWRQMLAEAGVALSPPEPSTYRVLDFSDRIWFRNNGRWSTGVWRCPELTWRDLVRKYGPHNIKVLA